MAWVGPSAAAAGAAAATAAAEAAGAVGRARSRGGDRRPVPSAPGLLGLLGRAGPPPLIVFAPPPPAPGPHPPPLRLPLPFVLNSTGQPSRPGFGRSALRGWTP